MSKKFYYLILYVLITVLFISKAGKEIGDPFFETMQKFPMYSMAVGLVLAIPIYIWIWSAHSSAALDDLKARAEKAEKQSEEDRKNLITADQRAVRRLEADKLELEDRRRMLEADKLKVEAKFREADALLDKAEEAQQKADDAMFNSNKIADERIRVKNKELDEMKKLVAQVKRECKIQKNKASNASSQLARIKHKQRAV